MVFSLQINDIMKKNKSKHRFAYDTIAKKIIDIENIKTKSKYTCLSCNNEMITKMGKIKIHHFAHKSNTVNCSYETYLHKLAKKTFYNEFQKCINNKLPFYVEYLNIRNCHTYNKEIINICDKVYIKKKYDLTQIFNKIFLEKKDDKFIPDITLTNDRGDKLYIEIAVTHKCEDYKINSGIKIIELDIKSEEDIKPIFNHFLPLNEGKITHYNFKMGVVKNLCNECDILGDSFKVYKSKKAILFEYVSLKEHILNNTISMTYSNFTISEEYQTDYFEEVWNAYEKDNTIIKDCNLCKYNGYVKRGKGHVFCKIDKKYTNSQVAVNCDKYRIMKNRYDIYYKPYKLTK